MSQPTADNLDLAALRAGLEANRDSIPWHERLTLAATLCRLLAGSAGSDDLLALVHLLAADPAPEVRKEIAGTLVHLPVSDFSGLAAALGQDQNAYVQHAADRAIARRRRTARETQRVRRNLGAVESRVASFEGTYGPEATRRMRRISDEQFSSLVRQTDHDLRQIFSPIKTSISSLLRQFEGTPDPRFCQTTLGEMARRMEYLEQFLTDLKEYAKATSAERRRERLIEVVREAKAITQTTLRKAGVPVDRVQFSEDVPEALTVGIARHQVLLALVHVLRNAVEAFDDKASRRRGRKVRIQATLDGLERVVLTITDNACGIHPEDLDLLREFVPGKKSGKLGGTGFGLPTAVRYVVAQGGAMTLDSTLTVGTTITMVLPITCEEDDA